MSAGSQACTVDEYSACTGVNQSQVKVLKVTSYSVV
jgi:hypothetical protein